LRKARRKQSQTLGTRINESIAAREVRVIDEEQGNLGVLSRDEAIKIAKERGLDLIEISADAKPPVAKITDYGRYQYEQKRKQRDIKAKARESRVEVKEVQIKPGTGENDIRLKASRADKWLTEGHRVKAELFLRGRSKYMEKDFLEGRLQTFLTYLSVPHKVVDPVKKVPKGLALIVELDRKAEKEQSQESTSEE
jgi:translation initiation factor IF-3